MRREAIAARPGWQHKVEQLDFNWHTIDGQPYWAEDRCYAFTSAEIDGLEEVTGELHRLCKLAVEKVIKDRLWDRFNIPKEFAPYIETTWRRPDPEIYGRFDLLYDGTAAPKLLENKAETPTALYEAAVVQWYWLQDVKPKADQFNSIHEKLIEAWKGVLKLLPSRGLVHFACDQESVEDFGTTEYMRDVATQAGLKTQPIALADIGWNGQRFTDLSEEHIQALF
jgi:glutathionylspermidine synthase